MHDYERPPDQSREWYNWTVERAIEEIIEMAAYDSEMSGQRRDSEVDD